MVSGSGPASFLRVSRCALSCTASGALDVLLIGCPAWGRKRGAYRGGDGWGS